jgi:indole-3-glycerol phosphate synthase
VKRETTTDTRGVVAPAGVLEKIVRAKSVRLNRAKQLRPIGELIEQAAAARSVNSPSFARAISKADRTNIIAEIKQRSPSKGVIREEFDPGALAGGYERAGAAAISVLAEEDYFGGSLDHLRAARARVRSPLLRKDFIFDEYQIYESVEAGADAALLIVAMLEDFLLARLISLAGELAIDALVEVHSEGEMTRAARAGARIIGVNNRDLATFTVDLETSIRLSQVAPGGAILVSESGISTGEDVRRLKDAGYSAFLIGEHFMRATDPGSALRELIEEGSQ